MATGPTLSEPDTLYGQTLEYNSEDGSVLLGAFVGYHQDNDETVFEVENNLGELICVRRHMVVRVV